MSTLVDKVAEAVLYEGYILYPYRPSSRKNRERFTFGRVYPRPYSEAQSGAEPCIMQTECLALLTSHGGSFNGRVRFLHPMARDLFSASPSGTPGQQLAELRVDGQLYQAWHEAVERDIAIPELPLGAKGRRTVDFYFPSSQVDEPVHDADGRIAGIIRRRQHALAGEIELAVEPLEPLDPRVSRITVRICNRTPMSDAQLSDPEAVLLGTLASTHTILRALRAEFVSLTDPPADNALAVTTCENIGTWPVLVGDEETQERDTILSSPIILYDYPKIAPESPGALCDGLEIDEILSLRILTMTDSEKSEMRNVDAHARRILERTESLREEDFLKMHGTMRDIHFPSCDAFNKDQNDRLDTASIGGVWHHAGDRVRIHPRNRADAMDMILAGKIAVIEAIEQDAEQRIHLALVLDDDPGRDLGMMRQPGHRFFYGLDEVEALREGE